MPEDTSPWKDILQVSAQDADANSKLVFSIHNRQDRDSSTLFHLDPKSGVLVLKEPLDYETSAVHTLVLMVQQQSVDPEPGGPSEPIHLLYLLLLRCATRRSQ